jgi:OOP family OmpA-OmpF porin
VNRAVRVSACALFALAGCTTGAALRREADTIQSQLDAAREAGAYRCAPRELAQAESNLEFLREELGQGNAVRASEHKGEASAALVGVLAKVKDCPPLVGDRDGDGLPDPQDACPTEPGPAEQGGCPDRDGDGLVDAQDACPDAAEDEDGVDDEDGCPEDEDSDDDGILDPDDACPNAPGPKKNRGCPDQDGDGLLDREDACPAVPGPEDNDGCPYGDRDSDGVLDKDDRCPDLPEDKDAFEDEDGCPEEDNDGDGVADAADRCPLAAETVNQFEDDDGCPDSKLTLVEVKRDIGKIEIKQKVYFDTGKATIKPVSFELLDQVAEALKTASTMHVLVEGHTDSVGNNLANLRLSQARADSVRVYLLAQGVSGERLTAMGFGEEKPIDSNQTKQGRENNRRVEFTITKE